MSDKENSGPVRGSGNFLADLGYDDPEEMRIKHLISNEIAMIIEDRDLTQARVAGMCGLAQPDVSRIVNGRVKDYSFFRLMKVLASLGKDIRVEWSDATSDVGHIVAYAHEAPEAEAAFRP